ncbi:MAG: ribonuclease P protein subunit [Deltaproteobacteria bacterium]|nr:ribonuclease P protein subunit [Deltaproteobacteria bacterium]
MSRQDTIYQHELISRPVTVAHATDPNQIGIRGIVIDESRQTLTILSDEKDAPKMIPKAGSRFHFTDEGVMVNGSQIIFRPEDRVKRLAPRFKKKNVRAKTKRSNSC